ncbi:MAG: glycosyltransferase [Patescibacteria group bacterium]|jgi:glycosyltransferase involved in cell wall biosynthesis
MAKNSPTNSKSIQKNIKTGIKPRVAVFYDWLNQWGGAEKVLLDILKAFPDAVLFTLVHDPSKTKWLPPNQKVITSFLNRLPHAKNNPIYYTPFYDLATEQFDFNNFDIIISTTSTIGHTLLTPPHSLFVCYFHNINRYLYQTPRKYRILTPLLNLYKSLDQIYKYRPDYLFCNSQTVKKRISRHFNRDAQIIHPGINVNLFTPSKKLHNSQKYFLIVSRLVPHKKVDICIKACAQLGLNLKIVGTGRQYFQLEELIKNLNADNIKLLGSVSQKKLIHLYQNCQAIICPQLEDFGIVPLEAQACGKPVIAYNKGGVTETVIAGKTGLFFDHQTVVSLANILKMFDSWNFSPQECHRNAKRFSDNNFVLHFKKSVLKLWLEKVKTTSL